MDSKEALEWFNQNKKKVKELDDTGSVESIDDILRLSGIK